MMRIGKGLKLNKVLAFMLIGIFLSSNLVYSSEISHLRPPILENKERKRKVLFEKAMSEWFGPNSTRQDESRLWEFLVENGEEAIDEFVRLVEEDREGTKIGPYKVKRLDPSKISNTTEGNSPGSDGAMYPLPYRMEQYERERLGLMAHVAIQKSLGRKVVLNIGIGHVGTAVMLVTSKAKAELKPAVKGKRFRSPLSGEQHIYDIIGYDRPLPFSYYKIPMVKNGVMPIKTADKTADSILKEGHERGNITATFIPESVAIADIIMVETELHVRKLVPRYLEQDFATPDASLRLLKQVGSLMHKDALVIIESTVYPGFSVFEALPVLDRELKERGLLEDGESANLAYAFQRLRPGAEWISSLMNLERIGAGVNEESRKMLEEYFRSVGFKHQVWDETTVSEFIKDLENAWTFGLLDLMSAFMKAAEKAGIDCFKVVEEIIKARPDTHAAMAMMPSIQVGGYCVPKELCQMIYGLRRHFGLSELQIMDIFGSRLYSAGMSDYRGEDVAWHLLRKFSEQGISMDEATIGWLGAAYKEGNEDTRFGGTERALRLAAHYGADNQVTDPYARYWKELAQQDLNNPECWGYKMKNQQQLRDLRIDYRESPYSFINPRQDALVLATRHWQYIGRYQSRKMKTQINSDENMIVHDGLDPIKIAARMMGLEGKILVDTYNFLSDKDMQILLALGFEISAFGKGHIDRLKAGITLKQKIKANAQLLKELKSMEKAGTFDDNEIVTAINAVQARLEYLRAEEKLGADENEHKLKLQFRYLKTQVEQKKRFYAKESEKDFLDVSIELYDAFLTTPDSEKEIRIKTRRVQELEEENKKRVMEKLKTDVLEVAKRRVIPYLDKAASILKVLSMELGREFIVPTSVDQIIEIAKMLQYIKDRSLQPLVNDADRMVFEMLTPEGVENFARMERLLNPRPELKVSNEYLENTDGFDIPEGCKGKLLVSTVFEQGENGKIVKKEDPTSKSYRYTLKWVKDMIIRKSKRELPVTWSKHTMEVPLNLVKVQEGSMEVDVFPEFMDCPFEFRKWLLEEVWGKGYILSTLDGEPQDKILYLMDVNLDPRTKARGRGGVLIWQDTREPVIAASDEGCEFICDIKSFGDYMGGDPERLFVQYNRPVRGGKLKGVNAVDITLMGQVPGHMFSAEDVNRLNRLKLETEYHSGRTPRIAFRLKWKYIGSDEIFQGVGRLSPSTMRIGHIMPGTDEEWDFEYIARTMGWNTAEILTHYIACVHIAVNPDNILNTGYYTDTGSNIDLFNERDPYGAFYKYFGYCLQLCLYTFTEVDKRDFSQPSIETLPYWLDGFMKHFLEVDNGKKVKNADKFREIYFKNAQSVIAYLTQDGKNPEEFIDEFIDTIWNHYLAYQLLKNRLEFGYDPTTESTYTGGSNKLHFHPSSEKHAMKFIDDQKELLTIARRLIEEEGYEPLIYEGRPFDFHAAFAELDDKEKSIGALRKNTNDPERFASVYELSFYPALKSEPLAVLDLLSVFADEPVVRIVLRRERPQAFIDKFEAAEQVRIRGKGLRVKKLHDRGLSLSEEWGIPAIPVYLNAWRELNPDAPEINAMEYPEEVFGMMTDDFRANKALDPLKNYPDFKWLSHESRTGSFVFYYEVGGKAYTVEVKKSNREATVEIGLPEIEIPDGPLRSDI